MKTEIDILQMAHAMAAHASARQSVVAENIANADTPGYKARDIRPFADLYQQTFDKMPLKTTRNAHFSGLTASSAGLAAVPDNGAEAAPNGNSVSLEEQMTKAANVRQEYDMALGIYMKSISILRKSLGR